MALALATESSPAAFIFEVEGTQDAAERVQASNFGAAQSLSLLTEEVSKMGLLHWTILFLIVAIVAAVMGFTGLASTAAGVARILFGIFLVLFLVSLVVGALHGY